MRRLFVWDNVQAISSATAGYCLALAETKEQAIEVILACSEGPQYPETKKALRQELDTTEPAVLDEPTGFVIWGGD